jgi:uncharacterized protein YjbJ (UPF0337 family)
MNWENIEGKWDQFKGKIKQQWARLTDDDIQRISGKKDQLVGKLKEKYGYEKDKAEREVDSFCSRCH